MKQISLHLNCAALLLLACGSTLVLAHSTNQAVLETIGVLHANGPAPCVSWSPCALPEDSRMPNTIADGTVPVPWCPPRTSCANPVDKTINGLRKDAVSAAGVYQGTTFGRAEHDQREPLPCAAELALEMSPNAASRRASA